MSQELQEFLHRGVDSIIQEEELSSMLEKGDTIRIYLGVDPSGPTIHLGHAVALRKLREFQLMGHKVILLIGDFTARIGDPTDKDAMRVPLTHEDVLENAKTYKEQAAKILEFDGDNPAEIRFNADWHDKMSFKDVIELSQNFTVQQLLERDMFVNRMKDGKPIGLHEFLYPVMQGYDSVALDVDVEVGGSDQLFNMLAGRTLLSKLKKKTKVVMTFKLLEGTDGRKMSKSYNNYIGVMDDPSDMYGKTMSMKDELILQYFELCTDVSDDEMKKVEAGLKNGDNPRDYKMQLAREIVTLYHSAADAKKAEEEFINVFQKKGKPDEIEEMSLGYDKGTLLDILVDSKLASSKSDARRVIKQGGVKVDDEVKKDESEEIEIGGGVVIQKGKLHYLKVKK